MRTHGGPDGRWTFDAEGGLASRPGRGRMRSRAAPSRGSARPIAVGHGGPLVVFSRVIGGDRLTALETRALCRSAGPVPDSRCAAWHLI